MSPQFLAPVILLVSLPRRSDHRSETRRITFVFVPSEGGWRSVLACFAVRLPGGEGKIFRRALRLDSVDSSDPTAGPRAPANRKTNHGLVGYVTRIPSLDPARQYIAFGWSDQWPPTNADPADNDQDLGPSSEGRYVAVPASTLQPTAQSKVRPVRVYRSGPLILPAHSGEIARLYAQVDALRPVGRPGRAQILFCSPSLFGASRWFRANLLVEGPKADVAVREIRLADDPSIYVYSVAAWERASHDASSPVDVRAFWAGGLTLSSWYERATTDQLDAREWEVLVPPEAVLGARPVADDRVLASIPLTDWTHAALVSELRQARRARRW